MNNFFSLEAQMKYKDDTYLSRLAVWSKGKIIKCLPSHPCFARWCEVNDFISTAEYVSAYFLFPITKYQVLRYIKVLKEAGVVRNCSVFISEMPKEMEGRCDSGICVEVRANPDKVCNEEFIFLCQLVRMGQERCNFPLIVNWILTHTKLSEWKAICAAHTIKFRLEMIPTGHMAIPSSFKYLDKFDRKFGSPLRETGIHNISCQAWFNADSLNVYMEDEESVLDYLKGV